MHLPYHPAPGFGELLPGSFVVPQNPIRDAGTALVPSVQAKALGRIVRVPHIAELLPGQFDVPQNPLRDALLSSSVVKTQSTKGMGCIGCGAGMDGLGSMGDLSSTMSSFTGWLTTPLFTVAGIGVPPWMLGVAGVGAYMLLAPGGKEYRQQSRALRSQHRGYRRLGRAIGRASNPRRRARRRKNVAEGFYNATGFHPIRASYDYSPGRAGEKRRGPRAGKGAYRLRGGKTFRLAPGGR
jgi:hypothetical protein